MSREPVGVMALDEPAERVGDAATSGEPGRLLELSVVDLALIDRLRLELEPGLNVFTGRDGGGEEPADRRARAGDRRARGHDPRPARRRGRARHRAVRSPPGAADRRPRGVGRGPVDGPAGRRAGHRRPARRGHGPAGRDPRPARPAAAPRRTLAARPPRRVRRPRAAPGGDGGRRRPLAREPDPARHPRARSARADPAPRAGRARGERDRRRPPAPGEADEIRGRLEAARHGETIARGGATAAEALAGEEGSARERIAIATREVRDLGHLDARYEPLAERLAGLEAELVDVVETVRDLAESVDHDPAELDRLSERLSAIHALERRYGDDEAAVIAHGERAAAEADRLRGLDDERALRQADDARLLERVAAAAADLSAAAPDGGGRGSAPRSTRSSSSSASRPGCSRSGSAGGLPTTTSRRSRSTGTPSPSTPAGSTRSCSVSPRTPGEPARPLARIASGGELSRVALAIRQVLAEADDTATLVFDEIDTGIGGRSADPIGRSLWLLGRRHQVLCVTHLPQIAAHADAHFRIAKRERDGRTVTEVVRLDGEDRVREIGAMLGGEVAATSEAALASARELLDRADAWRARAAISA